MSAAASNSTQLNEPEPFSSPGDPDTNSLSDHPIQVCDRVNSCAFRMLIYRHLRVEYWSRIPLPGLSTVMPQYLG
jgi:hypothetical protein